MILERAITHLNRLLVLALCTGLSALWAFSLQKAIPLATRDMDLREIYIGARCAMQRSDPYDGPTSQREFEAEGGRLAWTSSKWAREARAEVMVDRNLPTTLLLVAPIATLSWPIALATWLGVIAGLLVLAAFQVWDLASDAPMVAGCMMCFMLLNVVCEFLLGNPAGFTVPLSLIAAWCFFRRENCFGIAGTVMLAISLVVKPQDSGFIWLYFLLGGGSGRRRAMQTFALVCMFCIVAALWIAPASPRWMRELHGNLGGDQVRGSLNDPGPSGMTREDFVPMICLQSALSVFKDDPGFYNSVSYLVVGGLMLVWVIAVLRGPFSRERALLGLASVSALSLLPVYHRTYDAKLLLLMIPACTMLWARGGPKRWIALGLSSAAIFATSDVPNIIRSLSATDLSISVGTLTGKLTLLALQPAPLVLLGTGCFYLWVYIRYEPTSGIAHEGDEAGKSAAVAIA